MAKSSSHSSDAPASSPWRMPGRHSKAPKQTDRSAASDWWLDQSIGTFNKGDLVLNRFEIQQCIGKGGMSLVYQAWDRNRKEEIALKFLSPALLLEPDAKERFLNEARISIRLQHPSILRVYEVHEDQGIHFLSMELLRGENLRERILRRKSEQQAISIEEGLDILVSVAKALSYAHAHTVHRDIKPENIGIREDGRVFLMDFGLSEVTRPGETDQQRHTLSYVRVGTPYYMAPEQIKLAQQGDARSDQFSLAVVAYEMFSGDVPLGLSRPLCERLPPSFSQFGSVIDRALSNRPQARFKDMSHFAEALERNAKPQLNIRPWLKHHQKTLQLGVFALVAVTIFLASWLGFRWVTQQLAADKKAFERAREHLVAIDQMSLELATHFREKRAELEWLDKEFRLEQRAWNTGITNQVQWTKLLTTSNRLAKAKFLWDKIQPNLSSRDLPISVSILKDLSDENQQTPSAAELTERGIALSNEIVASRLRFDELEARLDEEFETHRLREQVSLLRAIQPSLDWPTPWIPSTDDPTPTFEASRLKQVLETQAKQHLTEATEALEAWNGLFGKEGAPNLSFLGSPSEGLRQAAILTEEGNLAAAIASRIESTKLLQKWTVEVRALHQRSEASWNNSEHKFETDMGMRFVKHRGRYWSIWETRVMDFARYIQEFPERSQVVGDFWQNPGYPQGPTHPVVGIDQETAAHFATWIAHRIRFKYKSPLGSLPSTKQWRQLLQDFGIQPRLGLYPNRPEWNSNHFTLYYSDPELDPSRYTRATGLQQALPIGIFDATGNVWEWCTDLYEFPAEFRAHAEPDTWALMGGNPFQQTSYQSYSPPAPDIIWVIQKHTIGFRILLQIQP